MGMAAIETLVETVGEDKARGNLRSMMSGLVFAVTAQAAWTGLLSPAREALSALWTVDGGAARELTVRLGIGHGGALAFGGLWLLAGGCAAGTGLSGAAVFTITSWVALCAIWAAAAINDPLVDRLVDRPVDRLVDQRPDPQHRPGSDPADQAVPGSAALA